MDQRSPAFEATLLSVVPTMPDLSDLRTDLEDLLEDYGEVLCTFEKIENRYYLATSETVQILFAFTDDTLPLDGFLQAERPAAAVLKDTEILHRLTQVASAMTVIVLPANPETPTHGAAFEKLMTFLCWDIVECLYDASSVDLVFWSDTETLYSGEEFKRACLCETAVPGYVVPDIPVSPENAPIDLTAIDLTADNRFSSVPDVNEEARAWFEGDAPAAPEVDENDTESASLLANLTAYIPLNVTSEVDAEERKTTMQRFSMAATTATVSLTSAPKVLSIFV